MIGLMCLVRYDDTMAELVELTQKQVDEKFPAQASVTSGSAQRVDPSIKITKSIECVFYKPVYFFSHAHGLSSVGKSS
jgi:hypothetical protein